MVELWNPLYTGTVWLAVALAAAIGILGERRLGANAGLRGRPGLPPENPAAEQTADGDEKAGTGTGRGPGTLTERELELGNYASRYLTRLCWMSCAASTVLAVWLFLQVPLNTMVPGRIYRYGDGDQVLAVLPMLLPPAWALMLERTGRKPDAGHMGKGSRRGLIIGGSALVIWPVYFQLHFVARALTEGYAP